MEENTQEVVEVTEEVAEEVKTEETAQFLYSLHKKLWGGIWKIL